MVTQTVLVPLEPYRFYVRSEGVFVDIIIQNISANHIYFGDTPTLDPTQGLIINPNGILEFKDYQSDVWLCSDVVDSEVRIVIQEFRLNNRMRSI